MAFPILLKFVLYIIINIISLYTLKCALDSIMQLKDNLKTIYKFIIVVVYILVASLTYIVTEVPLLNLVIHISLILMVCTMYKCNLKRKILVSFIIIMLNMICEIIIGFTYSLITKLPVHEIIVNDVSKIIGTILSNIIPLIIVKLFQVYMLKKNTNDKFLIFDSLQVIIIPLCSIIIMHSLNYIYIDYTNGTQWLVIFSLIILIIINLVFYYLFDKLRKSEKIKYENDFLKAQTEYYINQEKILNTNFEIIRTIKHDLSHHLLYIKAKLDENTDIALHELNKTVTLLIGDISSENMQIFSKNIKINTLLNYKLELARKRNINLDIKVNIQENAVIDDNSLYVILGNAIDNAIENFNAKESKYNKLMIRIFDDNNNLFIKIANPYYGGLKFKNGLPVTGKNNKTMHGIGLQRIKKLIKDKNGLLKIKTQDNIFILEILLYEEIINNC